MPFKQVPLFRDDDGNEVRFVKPDPARGATPGYTHRVVVNGKMTSLWLGDGWKPSAKSAQYMLDTAVEKGYAERRVKE